MRLYKLSPKDFILAQRDPEPTLLLAEAANLKAVQRAVQVLAYISEQTIPSRSRIIIKGFLETEPERIADLGWSPITRSWYQNVVRMPVWDEISREQVALLNQFESLVFNPQHPQRYFETGHVALLEQSRYCSPDLTWGWRSDEAIHTQVPIEFLQDLYAHARTLVGGEEVRTENGALAGTLRKFPTIEGRAVVTNFHPALKVTLSGTNQRTSGVVQGEVDWERYPDDFDFAVFAAPFQLMKRSWSEEFDDFLETLRVIVPMAPDTRAKAFTVSSHQGAIFVTPHDELRMFEMLLHEKAHVKQRHINDIWPLLEAEQSAERFIVPWRPDPRPIHGIFEGIYVFLQVAVGLARLGPLCVPTAQERARVLMNHLKVGLEIIGENARMTPAGLEFFEGVSKAWRTNGELLGCDF